MSDFVKIDVNVSVNTAYIKTKTANAERKAIKATAIEFARLANPYVRYSEENQKVHMADTAKFSNFDKGEITYDTAYASATYYNTSNKVTRVRHPLATPRWGDVVKAKHMRNLQRVMQENLDKG